MTSIVFLVSGGGGSLKYIIQSIKFFDRAFKVIAVIGDRDSDAIIYAKSQKIHSYVINYKSSEPNELNVLLSSIKPDIIITNIHKVLDKTTLQACKSHFINLHYSLLPSFKGLIGMTTVDQAKVLNSKFIGVTSHIVSEELDGGEIISQATFIPKWEEQDIKIIYDTVFQAGCLVLLSTIISKCNIKSTIKSRYSSMLINGNNVIFSDLPPISKRTHSKIYHSINFK